MYLSFGKEQILKLATYLNECYQIGPPVIINHYVVSLSNQYYFMLLDANWLASSNIDQLLRFGITYVQAISSIG